MGGVSRGGVSLRLAGESGGGKKGVFGIIGFYSAYKNKVF
jgi:hypothetical protein